MWKESPSSCAENMHPIFGKERICTDGTYTNIRDTQKPPLDCKPLYGSNKEVCSDGTDLTIREKKQPKGPSKKPKTIFVEDDQGTLPPDGFTKPYTPNHGPILWYLNAEGNLWIMDCNIVLKASDLRTNKPPKDAVAQRISEETTVWVIKDNILWMPGKMDRPRTPEELRALAKERRERIDAREKIGRHASIDENMEELIWRIESATEVA